MQVSAEASKEMFLLVSLDPATHRLVVDISGPFANTAPAMCLRSAFLRIVESVDVPIGVTSMPELTLPVVGN